MPRRRSSAGRMDAAIDHFTPMGYNKAQVRSVVNTLLKVYGTEDGKQPWALLEDNCYQVVQDVLFEKQEEEEKLQLQLLQEQEKQSEEEGGAQEEQHEEVEEDDKAPQQEAAMQEAPLENNMTIVRVHTGLPSEAVSTVEEKEEVVPMTIDAPSHRAMLQHPLPAVVGLTRHPCYGWISESESDSDYEEHFGNRQYEVPVPTPGGDRLCKKKRPSRWDVK